MSKLSVFVLFLLFAFCSLSAHADGCVRRFRVAVNAYKPLYVVDRDGHLSGLTYELVREIERRVGCIFLQQPSDTPRMFEDFANWRTDFIAFMGKNDKAGATGNFVPLYSVNRKFIVAKSAYVPGKKVEEYLKDPKIKFTNQIGARMFYKPEEYNQLKDTGRVLEIPNPQASYQLLVEGRAQAMFSSPAIHNFHMKENKGFAEKLVTMSDTSEKVDIGLYISKKRVSPSEAQKVKAALINMRDDGTIKRIVLQFVNKEDLASYENFD